MPASSAIASGVAGRYALALFELARDGGQLDPVAGDLAAFKAMLDDSADLRRLIRSPVITREDQGKALAALSKRAGFAELTSKFLGVLAEHRRLYVLPEVIEAYRTMLAEHKGEVGAELVSAVPLQEQQVATLREQLSAAVGKQVSLSARVDPGLLGGLVVRVGSRMLDASLRTKLRQLELAMKGAA
ncbi:MAG TPA: F0F1 ATP synthase subunit delta [Geminicoccaceae bacterium]|nr:F0F1 ATP synthase subunit delta [Geminicoccaceae bacterium]